MKEIVILHIFTDEKFFDGASDFFDSLSGVKNLYYFYTSDENYSFRYINKKEKVCICTSYEEYINLLSSSSIDIVYLQSLPEKFYKFLKHVNPKTMVIWWCFGFEIYYPIRLLPPLVKVNLYKPLTLRCMHSHDEYPLFKKIARTICRVFRYPCDYINQMRALKRIDYFSPVLPIDYEMMKKNPYFNAKPFMINGGPGLFKDLHFSYYQYAQNILIGNSFTYTNNHLDIFDKIRHYKLINQQYIIPINYGTDYNINKIAFKELANLPDESVIWLDDFVPYEKYKVILSTVSHAIFGHMRQQALGNIYRCIENGAKLFLFKDSVVYKQLIDFGFIIYTIEDDLCEDALKEPLSKECAFRNYSIRCNQIKDRKSKTEMELQRIVSLAKE